MIKVLEVEKKFGQKIVLKNFSLEVSKGETIALLGLSGSGKTTALKAICGLHLPDKGEIYVNDLLMTKDTLPVIRKHLGYVIQDGGLFPHLTARQNITVIASEARLEASELERRLIDLCRMTKIAPDLLERYPRELSGGQRQRIGIIRALILNPEIILMDEPMGALDPITRQELQIELKQICKDLQKSVVLVTHDLFEASFLADKILLLNEGQVIQQGTMEELTRDPANDFVVKFIQAQKHHL